MNYWMKELTMNEQTETRIKAWLDEIKAVPARDPQAARRARAVFLNQAVSAGELRRRTGWMFKFRKEQFAMNALISVFVIATLLFGGGMTVRASQDDLPDQPLYGVKTWSEDLSLRFEKNEEAQVERLMELAQIRTQEMAEMTTAGEPVPDRIRLRLEEHIQQALQICSSLDDAAMNRTLLRLQERLRDRDRDMEQLQLHANPDGLPTLERTRTMLQERLRLVEAGLLNHEMFRHAVQNGFQYGQDDTLTSPVQNQNQHQNGNGSQTGQPTLVPGGTNPGGPNLNLGGPNATPNGTNSNPVPGGPNPEPGGPNQNPGGNTNGAGSESDSGGNSSQGDGNGTGGNGSGGGGNLP